MSRSASCMGWRLNKLLTSTISWFHFVSHRRPTFSAPKNSPKSLQCVRETKPTGGQSPPSLGTMCQTSPSILQLSENLQVRIPPGHGSLISTFSHSQRQETDDGMLIAVLPCGSLSPLTLQKSSLSPLTLQKTCGSLSPLTLQKSSLSPRLVLHVTIA